MPSFAITLGRFTLCLEALISTDQVARNQELGCSILHTRGQSPKVAAIYMAILFDQDDGLSKEVCVGKEWKSKLWWRGHRFGFIKKIKH